MNDWKEALKLAFDTPAPLRKRAFLRQLCLPGMPIHVFLISQIGYIHKWVWCICASVLVTSLLCTAFLPETVLWLISGLTPLLALTVSAESGRSALHGMAELEMATRFSLRSVIFARLAILGLINLLTLAILLPIGLAGGTPLPFSAALYVITPFLLSSFTGLCIVRKHRGQEGVYACIGSSFGISIFLFLSHHIIPVLYQEQCLAVWLIAASALLLGNGKQCAALIKQTEEFAWN